MKLDADVKRIEELTEQIYSQSKELSELTPEIEKFKVSLAAKNA